MRLCLFNSRLFPMIKAIDIEQLLKNFVFRNTSSLDFLAFYCCLLMYWFLYKNTRIRIFEIQYTRQQLLTTCGDPFITQKKQNFKNTKLLTSTVSHPFLFAKLLHELIIYFLPFRFHMPFVYINFLQFELLEFWHGTFHSFFCLFLTSLPML